MGLKGDTCIAEVVVYKRQDYCQEQFSNTDLEILGAHAAVVASQPFVEILFVFQFIFEPYGVGRSVKINRHEWGKLNIAEVKVFEITVDCLDAEQLCCADCTPMGAFQDSSIGSCQCSCKFWDQICTISPLQGCHFFLPEGAVDRLTMLPTIRNATAR